MINQNDLQGRWHRRWLRAPGIVDEKTTVRWFQGGTLFADIRIPEDRPWALDRSGLHQFSQIELLNLLRAEGFAGHTTVVDGVCTWHHEINWHGPAPQPDIGTVEFKDNGDLIEEGVNANYRELWTSVPEEDFSATRYTASGRQAFLVSNEHSFLLAVGSPDEAHSSAGLKIALETGGATKEEIAAQFSSIYALGHWEGEEGIAELSTNPCCEGRAVLSRKSELLWHGLEFDGTWVTRVLNPQPISDNGD